MIFIDSNIWIYYLSERAPEHRRVREPLRKIILKEDMICNTVMILEVAHYFRALPKTDFERLIQYLTSLSNLRLFDVDRALMERSIELLEDYSHLGIGARDATIIATMESAGTNRIVTHDEAFKHLGFLKVIDPAS